MAIRGSLREAGAVDILQLLALGRKTGCLSLSDGISFGRVYLEDGLITHASIINRPDRLGELLVKNEVVSAEDVKRAITEQATSGKRLGEILVDGGSARDDVERFIRLQIEEAVYLLFTWSQGQFHFEPDERPPAHEIRVRLHPEGLLLEGARRVDEWTLIEKKIPVPSMIFALDLTHGVPEYSELAPEQRRALMLVDGKRTVGEIVKASGLLEFEGYRAVYGLLQAGYLRPHAEGSAEPPGPPQNTVESRRNLAVAFRRTGMIDEARRELLSILELAPEDASAKLALAEIELMQGEYRSAARRAMQVARGLPDQKDAFYLVALALEGAGRLEQADATLEAAMINHPRDPDLLLARAVVRTRMGDFPSACEAFTSYESARDEAAPLPPAYFIYSIPAFAGVGRGDAAALRARTGLKRYPRNAPLLANAGALAERRDETVEAEELFRRAIEADATLPQPRRGLAALLSARGAHLQARDLLEQLPKAAPESHRFVAAAALRDGSAEQASESTPSPEAGAEVDQASSARHSPISHQDLVRSSTVSS